jgi:hypothetical protein
MRSRANLWSTGDIGKLESNLRRDDPVSCRDAIRVVPNFRAEHAKAKEQGAE